MSTTFLEMRSPDAHRRREWTRGDVTVTEERDWRLNRDLYDLVGRDWQWTARRPWTGEQWRGWAEDPAVRTWVARRGGDLAGYFELRRAEDGIEIAYFGLAPGHTGKGLGGALLSRAIDEAWAWGAKRVWVHTCTLDHPAALPNYLARGMETFRVVEENL